MRKKLIYCEQCGGMELAGTDTFLIFHHLTFCCVDCRDDYRAAHDARESARAAATLATVADVMRRDKAAARRPASKRKRAA